MKSSPNFRQELWEFATCLQGLPPTPPPGLVDRNDGCPGMVLANENQPLHCQRELTWFGAKLKIHFPATLSEKAVTQ